MDAVSHYKRSNVHMYKTHQCFVLYIFYFHVFCILFFNFIAFLNSKLLLQLYDETIHTKLVTNNKHISVKREKGKKILMFKQYASTYAGKMEKQCYVSLF